MERIDMLGDSFLFRVARALRAYLGRKCTDGARLISPLAGTRCRSFTSYRWDGWRFMSERRREVFTDVGLDGSPCSPGSATDMAHLFSVLHVGLIQ